MSAEREPIAVIGTGYVGLVTAAGFADVRFLRSTGGLSEITAVAGTETAR